MTSVEKSQECIEFRIRLSRTQAVIAYITFLVLVLTAVSGYAVYHSIDIPEKMTVAESNQLEERYFDHVYGKLSPDEKQDDIFAQKSEKLPDWADKATVGLLAIGRSVKAHNKAIKSRRLVRYVFSGFFMASALLGIFLFRKYRVVR